MKSPKWLFEDKVVIPQEWSDRTTCHWCGRSVTTQWCQFCSDDLRSRRDGAHMTQGEREAELDFYFYGPGQLLMVPFGVLQQRVSSIVGRPIFTHEMIDVPMLYALHRARSD